MAAHWASCAYAERGNVIPVRHVALCQRVAVLCRAGAASPSNLKPS